MTRSSDHSGRDRTSAAVDADACERAWLEGIARGDRGAFEKLYLGYHGRLSRFLSRRTPRHDLVDEIVNDTLLTVWRTSATFRGESKVGTWILGIAYRRMLGALRCADLHQAHAARNDAEAFAATETESGDAEQRELRDWVGHGLALLPAEQRTTIELAYFLGQSCEEIAAIMDCPVGTVKARMFHARVRLRNTLPVLGGDPAESLPTATRRA